MAVFDLKLSLWKQLDELPEILKVDYVLIENQPAMKNPTMKSIAETLFAYFLCRGIIDKEVTTSSIKEVQYVSASNKAKLSEDTKKDGMNASQKYKFVKQQAIKTAVKLLDNSGSEMLQQHKKKDDLCDCLLQGLYVLKKTHAIVAETVTYLPADLPALAS